MKLNRTAACVAALALAVLPATASWAAEPSMHDVYATASSGRVGEAEQMMQQVLRDHPNSAKAHYVDAELLAREGRLAEARSQLATAQSLAPGLPFAKREAVAQLERQLQTSAPASRLVPSSTFGQAQHGFPWGLLLLIGAVILLVVAVIRARARRSAMIMNGSMPGAGPQPMYGGYGPNGPNGMAPGGGIGSGIMGGLATGAALGAGLVAGEALAHHFTDDDERHRAAPAQDFDANDNLGGNNFGVSDGGSWDDVGGGGDIGGGDWS